MVSLDKEMMTFDYGLPANCSWQSVRAECVLDSLGVAFATANEAIRFALQEGQHVTHDEQPSPKKPGALEAVNARLAEATVMQRRARIR